MIIKVISGQNFSGLEHYLTHDREHRIVDFRGVSTADAAAEEMGLVAGERSDVHLPALHVIFAAAPEDWPRMTDAMWQELSGAFEVEFGLSEHQKLVVEHPHPDEQTDGPHRHVGFNKIHPETFRLPRSSGRRARWDSAMSKRAWIIADRFAAKYDLRRVEDPTNAEATFRIPVKLMNRELQDGVISVAEKADLIRKALQEPDWSTRASALAQLDLEIVPTYPPRSAERDKITGVRIVDRRDPTNFLKASAFGREFSYAALERTRRPDSPDLAQTLSAAAPLDAASVTENRAFGARDLYHLQFADEVERWRRHRTKRKGDRNRLLKLQKAEKGQLSETLKAERQQILAGTPKQFYKLARSCFQSTEAEPRRREMESRHRRQLRELRPTKMPTWKSWLEARCAAGDSTASQLLEEMLARHKQNRRRPPKKVAVKQPAKENVAAPAQQPVRVVQNVSNQTSPAQSQAIVRKSPVLQNSRSTPSISQHEDLSPEVLQAALAASRARRR